MVFRVNRAGGAFSVFRLKFIVDGLEETIKNTFVGPRGALYVTSQEGLVSRASESVRVRGECGRCAHVTGMRRSWDLRTLRHR